jgi:glycosidase
MSASVFSPSVSQALADARQPGQKTVLLHGQNVSIPRPFPSPPDWRDKWIYFLLVDRFNNPLQPPAHAWDSPFGEFQGGTLKGIEEGLDYLLDLGVGAIWLSPVMKNLQSNPFTYHGYGAQDFLAIEPRFASDPAAHAQVEQELEELIDQAHARGIYIIFDVVLNHAGDVFAYVLPNGSLVSEAPKRSDRYPVRWRDENGVPRQDWPAPPQSSHADAAVWPSELRRNELFRQQGLGDEAGGDFASLKELVTDYSEWTATSGRVFPVRDALIRTFQYLIARFDVDGFRIDTLKFIEREFAQIFGNATREFALSIGKKNFFTFGEVYDNEEQIAHFIGRSTTEHTDLIGVDAALDFPLFFDLPSVVKGMSAPAQIVSMYAHRKAVQRHILTSHGEASRFFVTFLDNHDQRERFYYREDSDPDAFEDQLSLGLACLFALQGIPCVYYGTEQGLSGRGNSDANVREALWGRPAAFDQNADLFKSVKRISELRRDNPPLRYGRQYFRPLSGDGVHFGISPYPGGVLAFSRILNDREALVVANTNTQASWDGEVIVDYALNSAGSPLCLLYSNKEASGPTGYTPGPVGPVQERAGGSVEIHEPDGRITGGPLRSVPVHLEKMEIQVFGQT